MGMTDLINKSKSKDKKVVIKQDIKQDIKNEIINKPIQEKTNTSKLNIKSPNASNNTPTSRKLNIGIKQNTKTEIIKDTTKIEIKTPIKNESPFAGLSSTLSDIKDSKADSITDILGDISIENVQTSNQNDVTNNNNNTPIQQNLNSKPTLEDLEKFVFEEQPDDSTEDIALKFSRMLDNLSNTVGSDIPTILADTLLFMKNNAFLAEALKPSEIGELVKSMAKSYKYVATSQNKKTANKKIKTEKQNNILNSLDGLNF